MKRTPEGNRNRSEGLKRHWSQTERAASHRWALIFANTKVLVQHHEGSVEYVEDKFTLAPQGLRRCHQCHVIRPITSYWKGAPGKRIWSCRYCAALKQKTNRKPDTNTQLIRQRAQRWRHNHYDLFTQRIAEWKKQHPDYGANQRRKQRAIKVNNGVFKVTQTDLNRLLLRQRHECYICKAPLIDKELDHIIPVTRGGRHSIGNLAWACHKCNRSKSDRLLVSFRYSVRITR